MSDDNSTENIEVQAPEEVTPVVPESQPAIQEEVQATEPVAPTEVI